jgi:hypothetical protein
MQINRSSVLTILASLWAVGTAATALADTGPEPADCEVAVTDAAKSYLRSATLNVNGARWRYRPEADVLHLAEFRDTTEGTYDQIYYARFEIAADKRRLIGDFYLSGEGACANLHVQHARIKDPDWD